MNPYIIASAILATILTLAGAGIYLFVRQAEVSGTQSVFEARVTLRNTCDVGDDYFVVRVIGTGLTACGGAPRCIPGRSGGGTGRPP